jgi:bla regulator protein blaR1
VAPQEFAMTKGVWRGLVFGRKLLLATMCIAVAASAAQSPDPTDWQSAAGGKMAFEVASIKQSKPGTFFPPNFPLDPGDAYAPTGGRFSADFRVANYITFAYKLWLTQEQIQSMLAPLPKWVATDAFDIHARAPIDNPTKDQMRLMMQSLLADRFQLAIHFETQVVPVLALSIVKPGKLGPKLRPHAEGPPCDVVTDSAAPGSQGGSADVFPARCYVTVWDMKPNSMPRVGSRNTTMALLASALPGVGNLGRPVVDQTGLSGRFDFMIEWVPDSKGPAVPNVPPDLEGPTFLQALHEQLGLKLESTKVPIQVLVVDHVERPSEN